MRRRCFLLLLSLLLPLAIRASTAQVEPFSYAQYDIQRLPQPPSSRVTSFGNGPAFPREPLSTPAPSIQPVPAPAPMPSDHWVTSSFFSQGYDLSDVCATCEQLPRRSLMVSLGYDSWRGVSDFSSQNNGLSVGANYGTRLGRFSDLTSLGGQLGGSVGAYNWMGNTFHVGHEDEAQPQGFLTYGLFRKANEESDWSASLVQDWMFNNNFSVFAQNPTLAQWRGQVGYALNAWHEIGLWGTWRLHSDERSIPIFGATRWRAIDQFNLYWHYKWGIGGTDTWLWLGVPERGRLTGDGSLGDCLVGVLANVPLSDRWSLYTLVTYMHPSSSAGPQASVEDAWNFSLGFSFFPIGNARSNTVAGQCWSPQLPVANNGYFLVDTSRPL